MSRSSRSGDFTDQASAYARARPDYPAALVEELVRRVGVAAGDPVADVGAGTGILTRRLAARGLDVTAVEPSAAMRRLAATDGGVRWTEGTFEATGLEDGSQRWVTAAQAFHWADPSHALPEIRRVLRPGGAFTVLWNNRDPERSAALAFARDAIQRRVPRFDEGYRDRDWGEVLVEGGHFERLEKHDVSHVVPMPRERFLDLWRSHHLLNEAAGPEGVAGLVAEIAAYLHDVDRVDVTYACRSWTVWRT